MTRSRACFLSACLPILALAGALAFAEDEAVTVLEGLDPVYLTQGVERDGDEGRALVRGGFRYLFASDATRELFAGDPERFEVQLGGFCAKMGAPVRGNPSNFAVYNGRIYLFGSGGCRRDFTAHPADYVTTTAAAAVELPTSSEPADVRPLIEPAAETAGSGGDDWPQWGGPGRDFTASGRGLADRWPPDGPRKLWQRDLGEGFSAVAVAGGRLYTMTRRGDEEVVVALDAATGATVWERPYAAVFSDEYELELGPGPDATPLVTGGRVFTAGATSIFHALDRDDGKVLWRHDLIGEYGGTVRVRGYSCSPLAYRDTVIMMVGGEGHAVMAFRQEDGSVAWQSGDFKNSPSSPIVIDVGGQEQLVAFLFDEAVGMDPGSGKILWRQPHSTDYGLNISTPVWGDDGLLFLSSAYGGGSRMLRLTRSGGATTVEELWFSRKMRLHFGNAVRSGGYVFGSSGDFGPAFFTAAAVETGELLWRERGLAKASVVLAGDKLVLLDENGVLALAAPTTEGLGVISKVQLFDGVSWTVPTLAGTTLYARDRKQLVALDLGAE
jgi:outer membrane protein assembly factor BamB